MSDDILIQKKELDYILNLLEYKYDMDSILLVHTATLFVPRLIHMNFFPRDCFKSFFDFTSKEVAIACRIMLLDSYGLLFHIVLKEWGITSYKDINKIISAMDSIGSSGEIARNTKKVEFDDKFLSSNPLLEDNPLEEVSSAYNILIAASNTEIQINFPETIKNKNIFNPFKDFFNKIFGFNDGEDDDS